MPRTLVGWARRSALFSVITLVLLTVLDYVVGANSTAMHFARQTVIQSYALDQLVGGVEQVEMRKFWGFRRKSGFAGAHVDLYLYVSGPNGHVPLEMNLEQRNDNWLVISSSIPL